MACLSWVAMSVRIIQGDCADVFKAHTGFGAIVADIPSFMKFMGRKWDISAPDLSYVPPIPPRSKKHLRELQERHTFVKYWGARLAVAYDACDDDAVALIWAIPKQVDATMEAMRLAGWRIADTITHLFGQGWPKSKRELKPASELWILGIKGSPKLGIDACRVERGVLPSERRTSPTGSSRLFALGPTEGERHNPLGSWPANAALSHTEECERAGVRKVRSGDPHRADGTVAASGSRIAGPPAGTCLSAGFATDGTETIPAYRCLVGCDCGASWLASAGGEAPRCACGLPGWWACPVAAIDEQSGTLTSNAVTKPVNRGLGYGGGAGSVLEPRQSDSGGASRFFNTFCYFAKASGRIDKVTGVPKGERHTGCENLYWRTNEDNPFGFDQVTPEEWLTLPATERARGNAHTTVKSLQLMMHLHALTSAMRIGDLSAGSCSAAVAILLENRRRAARGLPPIEWVGAETCPEAITIGEARLRWWGGLSDEALETYLSDETVPTAETPLAGQLSLL